MATTEGWLRFESADELWHICKWLATGYEVKRGPLLKYQGTDGQEHRWSVDFQIRMDGQQPWILVEVKASTDLKEVERREMLAYGKTSVRNKLAQHPQVRLVAGREVRKWFRQRERAGELPPIEYQTGMLDDAARREKERQRNDTPERRKYKEAWWKSHPTKRAEYRETERRTGKRPYPKISRRRRQTSGTYNHKVYVRDYMRLYRIAKPLGINVDDLHILLLESGLTIIHAAQG